MTDQFIWAEKYRPKQLSEYVFSSPDVKSLVEHYVQQQDMPHLFLEGPPGTGKSSLVKVLLKELNVDPDDVLILNASKTNSVEDIRTDVSSFASSTPFGKFKVVILEEANRLTPEAQDALKMELDQPYCRFVFTTNEPRRTTPALRSRCTVIACNEQDEQIVLEHILGILVAEQIEDIDPEEVQHLVHDTYPDIRAAIVEAQRCCKGSKFQYIKASTKSYLTHLTDLLSRKAYAEIDSKIRLLRTDQIGPVFEHLVDRLQEMDQFSNIDSYRAAFICIGESMRDHSAVISPVLNLRVMFHKLSSI